MKNRVMRTDYPIRKIADDTYMISDFGIANCYLLIGEERALLIDCGLGIGDIKGAVEKITDKPILVVATHGHVDHAGGDGQFEKIYVHTLDTGKTYNFMTNYIVRKLFLIGSRGVVDKSIKVKDLVKYDKRPEVVGIEDGYVFDLGGRQVKVVHSVGHTYGSILLLDDKAKIAFVGDNMCPSPWLFLPNASYVDEWLESAREILKISDEYAIWWGHEGGFLSQGLIENVIKIGEEAIKKYKKNRILFRVIFYPCNDRVNGSVVFRSTRLIKKSK